MEAPLVLPADGAVQVQVTVGRADRGGHRGVEVHARPEDALRRRQWARYAAGVLTAAGAPGRKMPSRHVAADGAAGSAAEELYRGPEEAGLVFGPAFRGLRAVWRRDERCSRRPSLPDGIPTRGSGCIRRCWTRSAVGGAAGGDSGAPGNVTMPVGWQGVRVHAEGAPVLARSAAAGGGRRAESGRGGWRWGPGALGEVVGAARLASGQAERRERGRRDAGGPLRGGLGSGPYLRSGRAVRGYRRSRAEPGGRSGSRGRGRGCPRVRGPGDTGPGCRGRGARAGCDRGPHQGPGRRRPVGMVQPLTESLQALVRQWLAQERLPSSRLAIVTPGAVAAGPGEAGRTWPTPRCGA